MAGLHPNRIGLGFRPFAEVNVDMAGPFNIRHGKTRASIKVYAVLFVCSATRAISIEVCEDASAKSCMFSFQRHTARYGTPSVVYTDNGTNFRGAERMVREQLQLWNNNQSNWVRKWPTISWRFSPPYAPTWNSAVESMVKVFKTHLRQLMAELPSLLPREEFETICVQAASYMSRRPLGMVEEKGMEEPITPAHFLLSGNAFLGMIPTTMDTEGEVSPQVRKNMLDAINEKLWDRLQKEFVLEQHRVSSNDNENIQIGDVVQFYHPDRPTGLWPLALVSDIIEGRDGGRRKFLLTTNYKTKVTRRANGVIKIPWPVTPKSDRLCRPRNN